MRRGKRDGRRGNGGQRTDEKEGIEGRKNQRDNGG